MESDCTDPSRPFCDVAGQYQASGGLENTCIPEPGCSPTSCGARAPVCDVAAEECAPCARDEECALSSDGPRCAADGSCVECAVGSDCASGVCDPRSRACIPESDVLYVDPASAGFECTRAAPCVDLRWALATTASAYAPSTIHLAPGAYAGSFDVVTRVAILSDGEAVLSPSPGDSGPTLAVGGGADVLLSGLTVSGVGGGDGMAVIRCAARSGADAPRLRLLQAVVSGGPGAGIEGHGCAIDVEASSVTGNGGIGVWATAGTLSLTRSVVADNRGGGAFANGVMLVFRNNVVARNGASSGSIGGAFLGLLEPGSRFVHNTVVGNAAGNGGPGVFCWREEVLVNSIIYGNSDGSQIAGCRSRYSLVGPVPDDGKGNLDEEPVFLAAGSRGGFHLDPSSPGVDRGESSDVVDDIDGQIRPQGMGSDIGADEVAP